MMLALLLFAGLLIPAETAHGFAACEDAPPGMACVPGGPFTRGVDDDAFEDCFQYGRPKHHRSDAEPAMKVEVSTFYIDKTEVTYGDYIKCRRSGKCRIKGGPRYKDFNGPKQPVLGVSWYGAREYCEAHGKRLPTESEWEKAARGPDGDLYPWGNEPASCERAWVKDGRGRACGRKKGRGSPEVGRIQEVGTKPAGRYGLFDMVGNAEEWVFDWYSADWEACGEDCKGRDPKGPCDGAEKCKGHHMRVVKGGSWYWPACAATGYHRRPHHPSNSPAYHHFGFRCAASVEQARALRKK